MRAVAVAGFGLVAVACAAGAEDAAAPDVLPTGRECATAKVVCGAGRCVTEIDNRCEQPITCRAVAEAICQVGGETGRAEGASKEITTRGKRVASWETIVSCAEGAAVTTKLASLTCE